jgi:hypothetical protein
MLDQEWETSCSVCTEEDSDLRSLRNKYFIVNKRKVSGFRIHVGKFSKVFLPLIHCVIYCYLFGVPSLLGEQKR